jgi:hypothetical protein
MQVLGAFVGEVDDHDTTYAINGIRASPTHAACPPNKSLKLRSVQLGV